MRVEFELFGSESSVGFVLIPETDVEKTLINRLRPRSEDGSVGFMDWTGIRCLTVRVGKLLSDQQKCGLRR